MEIPWSVSHGVQWCLQGVVHKILIDNKLAFLIMPPPEILDMFPGFDVYSVRSDQTGSTCLNKQHKLDNCIVLNEHNTVFASKRSAICNRCFPRLTGVLNANGISIALAFFAGLTR